MKKFLSTVAFVVPSLWILPATAQDWQVYARKPGSVMEMNFKSVIARDGKVFYEYRERWLQQAIPRMESAIRGVADCKSRERGDMQSGGGYILRAIYTGTNQEIELDTACRIGNPSSVPARVAGSTIPLVDPVQPQRFDFTSPGPKPPLKVAFIYVGPIGDGGWTYAHDRGRNSLETQLGNRVQVTRVESVPEGPAAEPTLQTLIDQGNTLIFATSFGYMEPLLKAAGDNPRVRFEHAMGYKTARNVRTYEFRTDEGAYLAGIVAGSMTKTNIIGMVASIPIPEMVRNINAFTLGAQSVNPKVKTRVEWVSEWFNPPKEGQAAQTLIDGGADVLLQNTDSSAVLATAQRLGKRAIGWDSDMSKYGPKAHLGSVVLNWGPYYVKATRDVLDNTWVSSRMKWGVKEDAVALASVANDVPPVARQKLAEVTAGLTAGRFSIWRGPIVSNEGRTMLDADAAIDEGHLEGMYFLVMGVEGQLPKVK